MEQWIEGPGILYAREGWVVPKGVFSIIRGEPNTPMEELNVDEDEARWVVETLTAWLNRDR